jgi:hypothetical protein
VPQEQQDGYRRQLLQVLEKQDRGRSLEDELAQIPQEQRWAKARLLALKCIASDCGIEECNDLNMVGDFDSLLARLVAELPDELAKLWERGLLDDDLWTRGWRKILSNRASLLFESITEDCAPFTDPDGPGKYSAYYLGDPCEANAIMLVSIHM